MPRSCAAAIFRWSGAATEPSASRVCGTKHHAKAPWGPLDLPSHNLIESTPFQEGGQVIDRNIHPPTVYFPLTVKEAIMIEPTETESKEMMDVFVEAMIKADELSKTDPGAFHALPRTMPISRPDETKAAREMNVNFYAPKA